LKQYPEGKWTEEARIRVENFTLAQAPSNGAPAGTEAGNTAGNPAGGTAATAGAGTPATPNTTPAAKSSAGSPAMTAAPAMTPSRTTTGAPVKTAKPAAGSGDHGVQLGAFKSNADAAKRRWAHLDKEYPKLLAGLSPTVAPRKTASGTLYRLQVVGLTEKHARGICKSLKAKSQACVVIHSAHH
jgi:cell division protein FtsN